MKTQLENFSTEQLLAEIINRGKLFPAPTKTTRTPDHQDVIVGIGADHVANIIIHDDALSELEASVGDVTKRKQGPKVSHRKLVQFKDY